MPSAAPTFELGLSLAGGVSCGAYTAGVVDFLVEALDAWHDARERSDPEAPDHDVRLVAVGGASSGALTAAVLAAVLPFHLAPVRESTGEDVARRNPLYDSWVNMTGLADLLGNDDARAGGVRSLLDPTPVDRTARKAVEHQLVPRRQVRPWLADPLRILLSVADLGGLRLQALPTPGHSVPQVTEHGALLRFAVGGAGAPGSGAPLRADEVPIDLRADTVRREVRWAAWGKDLADAALASGAVPLVLPARRLNKPWAAFREAQLLLPGCRMVPARVVPLRPIAEGELNGARQFVGVDGGLIDNTALRAVRAELNLRDELACNPRQSDDVKRAVLMVDPMLDSAGMRDRQDGLDGGPGALLAALGRMLLDQVRADRADIALALDETVYSRFLVSPGRDRLNAGGCADLAGASLGGFGGYLSRDFRQHDYLLGRRNAQEALATHLTLPAEHPLFARWTDGQRQRHSWGTAAELPIVPLMGALHPRHGQVESLPAWPFLRVDPAHFNRLIDRRLETLYWATPSLILRLAGYLPWRLLIRSMLRRALLRAFGAGLRQHRLQ